jgi:hypothetical protein
LIGLFDSHPVASVVAVALLVRAMLAIGSAVVTDRYVIPDEGLYMAMGRTFVSGVPLETWYPGYGQSFYESLLGFNAPLVFLFGLFGADPVVGRLFSAVVGAAAAGITVAIGLRFLRPAFAAAAGLIVAVTPSQVLFSSAVLREAHVWLSLTLVGLGVVLMAGRDGRRFAVGVATVALGLLYLGQLRDQTLLAAAWAVPVALLIAPRRLWVPRMAVAIALAILMPSVGGIGYAGLTAVRGNADRLQEVRATLGADANTAFEPSQPSGSTPTSGQPDSASGLPAAEGDTSIVAGFGNLPRALLNVTMRPYPWESAPSLSLALARVENLEWYLLYVLAALGLVVSVRRRSARVALSFPLVLFLLMTGMAAVTQGNLGTAFRHRDQVLWALALGAAAGAQWLWLRRSQRRSATIPDTNTQASHADPVTTRA